MSLMKTTESSGDDQSGIAAGVFIVPLVIHTPAGNRSKSLQLSTTKRCHGTASTKNQVRQNKL